MFNHKEEDGNLPGLTSITISIGTVKLAAIGLGFVSAPADCQTYT